MNQKRILSLALAAAMALSLTACGSKSDSSSSADDTPTGVAVQVQPVTADTISTENKVSGKVVSDNESSAWPSPLPAHACSTVAVAWHAQGALFAADVPYGRSVGDRP